MAVAAFLGHTEKNEFRQSRKLTSLDGRVCRPYNDVLFCRSKMPLGLAVGRIINKFWQYFCCPGYLVFG